MINVDLFGARLRDPDKAALVKRWASEAFELPPEVTVMVTELRCSEPDCPPLETVIAVMRDDQRGPANHKLHKPLAEVTRDDVLELAADALLGGGSHGDPPNA